METIITTLIIKRLKCIIYKISVKNYIQFSNTIHIYISRNIKKMVKFI